MTRTPDLTPVPPRHPIRGRQRLFIDRRRMSRAMRRRPKRHRPAIPVLIRLIRLVEPGRVVQKHDSRLGGFDVDRAGVGRGVAGESSDVESALEGAVDGELWAKGLACPCDVATGGNGGGV